MNYQEPLPFAESALEPIMSTETLRYHYGRHYANYAAEVRRLTVGTRYENRPLTEIVAESRLSCDETALFNNAAQAWNHDFFFRSLAPVNAGGVPTGSFRDRVERDFGSLAALKAMLNEIAALRFGSGWLWLTSVCGRLEVTLTSNAETPCGYPGMTPLLAIDLWEHAYYLDWHNRRGEYVNAVVNHLLDWNMVSRRYEEYHPFFVQRTIFIAA